MESVLRAVAVYVILALLFRITGRRSMSHVTPFDFVLLLVVGGAIEQALLGEDFSLTNGVLVIATLLGLDVLVNWFKGRHPKVGRALDGLPTIVVFEGRPLHDRLRQARVTETEVMQSARESQGLIRIKDIQLAVLEVSGAISIIPRRKD